MGREARRVAVEFTHRVIIDVKLPKLPTIWLLLPSLHGDTEILVLPLEALDLGLSLDRTFMTQLDVSIHMKTELVQLPL